MSHEATNWARSQTVGNSPAKFVLLILADFAGTDWSCYPGVAALAKITEMDERTVRRSTARLIELGLIRTFYRYRPDGSKRSCRYQLLPDGADTAMPDVDDWSGVRAQDPEGASGAKEGPGTESGGTGQSGRGDRAESPLIPYIDPSLKEPSPVIPGASRTARATRIPDDFYPDAQMQAWFREQGYDRCIPNPKAAHEDFMDYWRAKGGADARKVDWPATWRRWMRTTADRVSRTSYGQGNGNGPRLQSTTDLKVQQTLDLAEQFRQMEGSQ